MRSFFLVLALLLTPLGSALAQTSSVRLVGLERELAISASDLAAAPRTQVRAELHGASHEFEGVLLTDLLARIDAPSGSAMRGDALTLAVLVTARDGYRVAFTLAELDSALGAKRVIVADRMDGAPLPTEDGPFRLVVEGERRGARSARMVDTIALVEIAD